jgi:hypothetical protein
MKPTLRLDGSSVGAVDLLIEETSQRLAVLRKPRIGFGWALASVFGMIGGAVFVATEGVSWGILVPFVVPTLAWPLWRYLETGARDEEVRLDTYLESLQALRTELRAMDSGDKGP